ncbi:MAG: biotin--[Mogibacterium sp.]|nr:biotin--[acetyl-CoA-carboxylase] ligase [Mogibacterium sp.]
MTTDLSHLNTLSAEAIRSFLPEPLRSNLRLTVYGTIDSTNNAARLAASALGAAQDAAPALFTAEEQTGGRGRFGRSFYSPRGSGLYLTYSFRPAFPLSEVTRVTPAAAVAAHRVLSRYSPDPLGIKWVNDLYRNGLKIAGILTEGCGSTTSGNFERLLVGIGVNCAPAAVPEDLRGIAGALTDSPEQLPDRNRLLAEIAAALHQALATGSTPGDPDCLRYYREHCLLTGQTVTVRPVGKPPYSAVVEGIGDGFELLVRTPDGRREALTSGEVSLQLR